MISRVIEIPGFDLFEPIGEGEFTTLWKARHFQLDRWVSIKILKPECTSDPAVVEHFLREARLAAELHHPNLIQVYDVRADNGLYYFIMEHVGGRTLADILDAEGPLAEERALTVTACVASVLRLAWDKANIIHGNLKPSKIRMDGGLLKVMYVGMSMRDREAPSDGGETRWVQGTPHYMAPEQAVGDFLDCRADMYALGATLYHAVTGRPPFASLDPGEAMRKHVEGYIPNPLDIAPSLSPGTAFLITKLMMKDRANRYAEWSQVLDAIEKVRSGRMLVSLNRDEAASTVRPPTGRKPMAIRHRKKEAAAPAVVVARVKSPPPSDPAPAPARVAPPPRASTPANAADPAPSRPSPPPQPAPAPATELAATAPSPPPAAASPAAPQRRRGRARVGAARPPDAAAPQAPVPVPADTVPEWVRSLVWVALFTWWVLLAYHLRVVQPHPSRETRRNAADSKVAATAGPTASSPSAATPATGVAPVAVEPAAELTQAEKDTLAQAARSAVDALSAGHDPAAVQAVAGLTSDGRSALFASRLDELRKTVDEAAQPDALIARALTARLRQPVTIHIEGNANTVVPRAVANNEVTAQIHRQQNGADVVKDVTFAIDELDPIDRAAWIDADAGPGQATAKVLFLLKAGDSAAAAALLGKCGMLSDALALHVKPAANGGTSHANTR